MIRNLLALSVAGVAVLAAEPPLLSLVDPDVKMIGGMRVDRTLSSPLGRYLLAQINEDNEGFRQFIEQTGFDPRRDVREIVVAGSEPRQKHGIVIARGVFNGPRIIAAAQSHGGVVETYNGVPIASHKSGKAIAVLDGSTALMGEEALVKYGIDHRNDIALPSFSLAAKASTLTNRYDAWAVSAGAPVPAQTNPGNPPQIKGMLQGIMETSAGAEFGSLVRISGEAVTRSEKDAQALVDVIRFMITMFRQNNTTNPQIQQLESVFNSLELRAESAVVKLVVSIPEADLEQWIKPGRRQRGGMKTVNFGTKANR